MAERKPCAANPMVPRINGDLSPFEIASLISEKCLVEPINFRKNEKAYVFFTPHGWDCLASSIHFGKWVPENELESQYFLEGYFFVDKNGISSTVVTNVITPNSATQGRAFAQLYSEENNAYAIVKDKEAELIRYSSKGKNNRTGAQINPFYEKFDFPCRVGFGHTHPNIGCFFSSVDKTSVFAVPGEPWITMVADPRREELLVAVGPELRTANVVTFKARKKDSSNTGRNRNALKHEFAEDLAELIKLLSTQLKAGNATKIKIGGKLPGTLKFKGKLNVPRRRKETKNHGSKK